MSIGENLEKIEDKIRIRSEMVGRSPGEITLVAVTKTVEVARMEEAITAGVDIIGESRVQEAKEKYGQLKSRVIWHLVGHLQRNKAKDAVRMFDLIHSVDSAKLAKEIDKQAGKVGKIQKILIEVNVSGEESKYGVTPEEAITLIEELSLLPHVRIKGLMTMAPLYESPEDSRQHFRKLKELGEEIKARNIKNVEMVYLSMGMSNDFEVAIEEGSNMVRIGRAIFGP